MNSLFADVTCGPKLPLFIVEYHPCNGPTIQPHLELGFNHSIKLGKLSLLPQFAGMLKVSLTDRIRKSSLLSIKNPPVVPDPISGLKISAPNRSKKDMIHVLKNHFSGWLRCHRTYRTISSYESRLVLPFVCIDVERFFAKVPHIDDDVDLFQALPFFGQMREEDPDSASFCKKLVLPKNRHTHTYIYVYTWI